jgi:hypothetical protein
VLVAKTNAFPSKEAIFVDDPSAFISTTFVPLSSNLILGFVA